MLRVVEAPVVTGVEDELTRNLETDGGTDGVGCGEVKVFLSVDPLGWGSLNLIAQAEIQS